jgi:hypothetical protein
MKGASDLVNGLLHIRMAYHYWDDFRRELQGTKGQNLLKLYTSKLEWIYNDLITNPNFTEEVREGIRKEWNSDTFALPAISEKLGLLNPDQRAVVEDLIDLILKGDNIQIVDERDIGQ